MPAKLNYSSTEELPTVMGVKDIQAFLGTGPQQAHDLLKSGQIHYVKVGRSYKISRNAFLEWLEGQSQPEEGRVKQPLKPEVETSQVDYLQEILEKGLVINLQIGGIPITGTIKLNK